MSASRQKIADYAKILLEKGFVLIDLETTGFPNDPQTDIIEIAIINHLGDVLMNTLVKPHGKIPSDASAVNGIYDIDVKDAPSFTDLYPDLVNLLHNQKVAAYNYTFEEAIFQSVCYRYHVNSIYPQEWYCPMRAYRQFVGQRSYVKLTQACMNEGVTVENAHRALGDCVMTLELIRKMAAGAANQTLPMFSNF